MKIMDGGVRKTEPPARSGGGAFCQNAVAGYGGFPKACNSPYALMPVIVQKGAERVVVCNLVFCPKCRRFKRGENGRPAAVGPFVHKADYKLFNVPRDWWQGDWPWRQKFAWETVTLAAEYEGCAGITLDFEDIAARVGREVQPNPDFQFDVMQIFGEQ